MKYFEMAQKVGANATDQVLKQALLDRLKHSFSVDKLQESANGFHFTATTGGGKSMVRNARVSGDVSIQRNGSNVSVIMRGHSSVAKSLLFAYTILFFMVLVVGLLPGFIETSEGSDAGDALVFLIFGIFIFHDIERKLEEPRTYLGDSLSSLGVEFG